MINESAKQLLQLINSSVDFDHRLAAMDVECSKAHIRMITKQGILTKDDCDELIEALDEITSDIESGVFACLPEHEDVHTNVDVAVEMRVGAIFEKIGIGRARNDVAPTTLKMWVRARSRSFLSQLLELVEAFILLGVTHRHVVMPGMTHLQAAQPVSFGHQCLAYAVMFLRDARRFRQSLIWINESPLGAGALAGISFNNDRQFLATQLGFDKPTLNSIDSVADRDFALDFLSACSITSIHASRLCEDVLIWLTPQFGFIDLPEGLVGRSSVMPHKKNPDALELVRAKSGRIIGNFNTLQIVLKGLSMSYCRDMQEDKEAIFDAADAMGLSLGVLKMLADNIIVNEKAMESAANSGFTTSTDYVDWLVLNQGISFKRAHHLVSELVKISEEQGVALADIPVSLRNKVDESLAAQDWPKFSAYDSMASKISYGGASPQEVLASAEKLNAYVRDLQNEINLGVL